MAILPSEIFATALDLMYAYTQELMYSNGMFLEIR